MKATYSKFVQRGRLQEYFIISKKSVFGLSRICVWIIEKSCERGPVMCHLKASINVTVGGYDEENVPIWSDQDTLITRYTAKSSFLTLINNFESDFIVYQSQAEAGSFVSTGQISIEIYRCAVLDLPISKDNA